MMRKPVVALVLAVLISMFAAPGYRLLTFAVLLFLFWAFELHWLVILGFVALVGAMQI